MQIVSSGDSFHEMSEPIFSNNEKNMVSLSFAEYAQKVVQVYKVRITNHKMKLWIFLVTFLFSRENKT